MGGIVFHPRHKKHNENVCICKNKIVSLQTIIMKCFNVNTLLILFSRCVVRRGRLFFLMVR